MVLIGIDPYPYYGTCAIATVRENGHLPGREQLRVSRTSTLEGFVVVRVNASKSNVLMVQAVRTLHSKINFKNFQPGILPIQDPFLISYILCWKNPTWEQKNPFQIANQSWKNKRQKHEGNQPYPPYPTSVFVLESWNMHNVQIMLEPFTSHQSTNPGARPRAPDAESPVSGAWYLRCTC